MRLRPHLRHQLQPLGLRGLVASAAGNGTQRRWGIIQVARPVETFVAIRTMIRWEPGVWSRTKHVKERFGVTAKRLALVRTLAKMTHLDGEICPASTVTATIFTIGAKKMVTVPLGIHDGAALRTSQLGGSLRHRLAAGVAAARTTAQAILITSAQTFQVGKTWKGTLVKYTRSVPTVLRKALMA